jgi:hypothetical protein
MAAAACIPLECATAIAEVATAKAAKGFIVWVTFEIPDRVIEPVAFAGRVFTSLEKAKKAFLGNVHNSYAHVPYRMHSCGEKDVVYIYVRNEDDIFVTNVAEDLENQARAIPQLFGHAGPGKFEASNFEYKLDAEE